MIGHSTNDCELSIIIPVLNEIELLPNFLVHLEQQSQKKHEIIIVDGGSTDGSLEFLKKWKNGKVIQSERGRAVQMNKGAAAARGELLYFVHVDSQLPKAFDYYLLKASCDYDAGCFRLDFDKKNSWLRLAASGSRWNHLLCRGGDQSLFIKVGIFFQIKGFDERYQVCEDLNLIKKLYQSARFVVLPQTLVTSSRRFYQKGTVKLLFYFRVLHLMHWVGFESKLLWSYYQRFVK